MLQDAFEVMLLRRRVSRKYRLTRLYFRATWSVWSSIARRLPPGGRREGFLSIFGALSMIALFVTWAAALIIGLGLLSWALQASSPLIEQIYLSGATFFTLGYGDVVPRRSLTRFISVAEAGMGLGFIAVVIGYLPVLYQLFSRREAHVILLDGRAGSPPTATTMLRRHAEAGSLASLNELLREWETWGAELLESHLSYPMLVYYRSQHDNQTWLAAITAIMEICALILVGVEESPALQARMTFTMARQVAVEMARSLGVSPSRHGGVDRLPPEMFARMLAVFEAAGLKWNGGPGAREVLASLRATYEPLLDGLGLRLILPLTEWIAAEDAVDHWQRGHRGMIARRLIEELSAQSGKPGPNPSVLRRSQLIKREPPPGYTIFRSCGGIKFFCFFFFKKRRLFLFYRLAPRSFRSAGPSSLASLIGVRVMDLMSLRGRPEAREISRSCVSIMARAGSSPSSPSSRVAGTFRLELRVPSM